MAFVVVGEVDEQVLGGHQLHDGVSQELHPLVVAPGAQRGGEEGKLKGEKDQMGSNFHCGNQNCYSTSTLSTLNDSI